MEAAAAAAADRRERTGVGRRGVGRCRAGAGVSRCGEGAGVGVGEAGSGVSGTGAVTTRVCTGATRMTAGVAAVSGCAGRNSPGASSTPCAVTTRAVAASSGSQRTAARPRAPRRPIRRRDSGREGGDAGGRTGMDRRSKEPAYSRMPDSPGQGVPARCCVSACLHGPGGAAGSASKEMVPHETGHLPGRFA